MKGIRHAKIREIIEDEVIGTQEELAEALFRHHIEVTQATVSRDIKELKLVKVPAEGGRWRYAAPVKIRPKVAEVPGVFQEFVAGIKASENIVVVKTLPGAASVVASAIDSEKWPEIIGTVAGDDSIIVVVKPRDAVETVIRKIWGLAL